MFKHHFPHTSSLRAKRSNPGEHSIKDSGLPRPLRGLAMTKSTQQGFSLFEVLISLFIISITLFGFAEVELKAFNTVKDIHQSFLEKYHHE